MLSCAQAGTVGALVRLARTSSVRARSTTSVVSRRGVSILSPRCTPSEPSTVLALDVPFQGCRLAEAGADPSRWAEHARVLEPSVPVDTLGVMDVTPPSPGTLDERSRAILDFEREAGSSTVPKERAIRERFGFSAARYHQLLNRILERPEALAYDPMLVRRLRRVRDARRRRRIAGRLGIRL